MSSSDIFCPACGAANSSEKTHCYACGKSLLQSEQENETLAAFSGSLLHNRYRILWPVGQGGFARVFKAEDTHTGRTVAVKAINLKALSAQEIIDATDTYNREIRFGTTLQHPGLPAVYDHFTDQETWYVISDFIEGKTLESAIQSVPNQRLPLQDVLEVGVQVCDVLSYLHSRQPPVIFRDIKPDNIMRAANGRVYLVDFGIARQFRPGQSRDTQSFGSPGYAAPEQYGTAQTTERSDIYSLGATLRALLTGNNPLDDSSGNDATTLPTVIPPDFSALLTRMLAMDPEQRPASAVEVKQQLESIAHSTGIRLSGVQVSPFQQAYSVYPSQAPTPPPPPPHAYYTPPGASGGYYSPSPGPLKSKRPAWQAPLLVILAILVVGAGAMGGSYFLRIGLFADPGPDVVSNNPAEITPGTTQLPKAPADKQHLSLAYSASEDMYNLEPTSVLDTQTWQIISMLYAGLVQLDDNMQVKPQLAESWQREADGLTWTFKLRPNLKFSDGTPLTSTDVVYSLDRAFDPALPGSGALWNLAFIKDAGERSSGKIASLIGNSLLAPDANTVQIKTASPIAYLPQALLCPCAAVVKKALVEKYGEKFGEHLNEGGSSGPFQVESFDSGWSLEMVPNPNYVGEKPQLTHVKVTYIADREAAFASYEAGEIAVTDVPVSAIMQEKSSSEFRQVSQIYTSYIGMNYLAKPFDNIKIRQAFALALDKDRLVNLTRPDMATPSNHIIPEGQDGYNPALKGPAGASTAGNVEEAKRLLEEALEEEGIDGVAGLPKITYSFSANSSDAATEADLIVEQWKKNLGVNVAKRALKFTDLLDKLETTKSKPDDIQLWRLNWIADYPDPRQWTIELFGPDKQYNHVNYGQNNIFEKEKQQQNQQKMADADAEMDAAKRTKMYQEIEQDLVNDVAWLPLYQPKRAYMVQPEVQNYALNPMEMIAPDNWSKVYISQ